MYCVIILADLHSSSSKDHQYCWWGDPGNNRTQLLQLLVMTVSYVHPIANLPLLLLMQSRSIVSGTLTINLPALHRNQWSVDSAKTDGDDVNNAREWERFRGGVEKYVNLQRFHVGVKPGKTVLWPNTRIARLPDDVISICFVVWVRWG